MPEPVSVTARSPVREFERFADTFNAFCGAIVGFALLAGTRAFTFTALLAWREPVLGGAGLMLLALLGWLRWRWPGNAVTVQGRGHGGSCAAR
ncbi:hypothetical protein [Burkholderia sp. WSM2232]|uniref:hypothetical protein n=1 Tax=Burkholderia sp. WSM2232 TaxID=944436 RepID=UPI0003FDEA7E|nr:hypothetical protein [Burkholderia sp. WSM2232]